MNKINYDKHDGIDGEPITETLFNNIESGVGKATSSTNLLVDRTNQEEESLSTIEGKIEHQDMEFDIAIGEHDTLDERLKADVSRFVEVWSGGNYMPFEGKNITIDNSKVGWIRDFSMKGETYQDPNNLSDIQSAGDLVDGKYKIEILSHGKNLFDESKLDLDGEYYTCNYNGAYMDSCKYMVKLKPNTTYRLAFDVPPKGSWVAVHFFSDGNEVLDFNNKGSNLNKTFMSPTGNNVYLTLTPNNPGQDIMLVKNVMLTLGDGNYSYKPYKENKTQILLDEPLMKLPNGIADTIEQRKDGVYLVQRIEKVTYAEGDENLDNCITDKTISYKAKATPIETKLDIDMSKWLTYQDMTYFTTTCNVQPTLSLKAPVDINAVVSELQTANYSLRRNNQQLEQENQQAEKELNTLQEQCDQQTADLLDMDMRVLILEE